MNGEAHVQVVDAGVGQEAVDVVDELGEGRSVLGLCVPALSHDEVDVDGAGGRALHAVAGAEQGEQLLDGGDGRVGGGTQGHDLPQEDAEGPDVRLDGVSEEEKDYSNKKQSP